MPADLQYMGPLNRNDFWIFSHEDPSEGQNWTCDECGMRFQPGSEYRCQNNRCCGVRPHDAAPRRAGHGKHRDGIPMPVEDDDSAQGGFNKKPRPGYKKSQNKKDAAQYKAGDKVMVKDFTRYPVWHEDGVIVEVFDERKACSFIASQKFDVGSLHVTFSGGEVMVKPAQQKTNLQQKVQADFEKKKDDDNNLLAQAEKDTDAAKAETAQVCDAAKVTRATAETTLPKISRAAAAYEKASQDDAAKKVEAAPAKTDDAAPQGN